MTPSMPTRCRASARGGWLAALVSQRAALPLVAGAVAAITLLHYLTSAHLLPYHAIYRSLYYLPLGVAAVVWGRRGGLLTALAVAALYAPHALLLPDPPAGKLLDNLLEVLSMTAMAGLTGALADRERRQRRQTEELRAYIGDVLLSLPLGVATLAPGGALTPQNPAAGPLLAGLEPGDLPPARGYAERPVGGRLVGIRRSPLHGIGGAPIGDVLVLEDVSEQRRLAEQIRQAERLAALGQLAGGLAHEVRNPLAIVRATAQMLARRLGARDGAAEPLRIMTEEADRIDRLVGALLDYARPRPLERAGVDLAALVRQLAAAMAPLALQHGVALRAETPPAPLLIRADAEQLRQAVLNVALNAIQASPPGGAVLLACSAGRAAARIEVEDCGPGIPPAVRGRMFDPFFTTRDDGAGMGLAVVARIISEHGGGLEVAERPGGGARVSIRLPAAGEAP